MIIGRQEIVFLYEYFYSLKYGNAKYKFKPSERAEQQIEKFISYLDAKYGLQSVGKVFITTYFNFQFQRVEGLSFKRFSSATKPGKIQIYDIIGRKAFDYWIYRNQDFDYSISTPIPWPSNPEEESSQVLNLAEEKEKGRFYNSTRGLINCLEHTTLYNRKSSKCLLCNFKDDCKLLLQKNYPNIYSLRNHGRSTERTA